jgi:hypothetical protein
MRLMGWRGVGECGSGRARMGWRDLSSRLAFGTFGTLVNDS